MMLKMSLLGLLLAGLLALPVGIALAEDATDEVTSTTAGELDRDQTRDQDRLRIQDPSVCETGAGQTDDSVASDVLGDQDRDRDQVRDRLHDGAADGAQLGEGAQLREGAQEQEQTREHTQLRDLDGSGENRQNGAGAQESGLGYRNGVDG